MDKRDLLIEKLEELVKFLDYPQYHEVRVVINRKKSEIASLRSEIESEKKININQPFFGNSGAEPDELNPEQIL